MSETTTEQLIRAIHDSPVRLVLAGGGGGSRAIADLLAVTGASRTVLEAIVPYNAAAMADWLGSMPEQFCSEPTARAMAMTAFRRAQRLVEGTRGGSPGERSGPSLRSDSATPPRSVCIAGIACTASLASDRPKRGPHRIHVAAQTAALTSTVSLELQKGPRTRGEEEAVATGLILDTIADVAGIGRRLDLGLLAAERIEATRTDAPEPWTRLLLGRTQVERLCGPATGGERAEAPTSGAAVFPGAFNPLHAGHLEMAHIAAGLLERRVEFEMSIENVEKPPLDFSEIRRRGDRLPSDATVWLTGAPTFRRKARIFPKATFIVGADTIARIADPHYSGNDREAMLAAIDEIAAAGCRFLVFGRLVGPALETLRSLPLPERLSNVCREVPIETFRMDISSTELRARA